MQTKQIPPASSAYAYPLLIKNILMSSQRHLQQHRINYRGQDQYDYQGFQKRVCKLANLLTGLGVKAGDTVAVMDWDSHRYLEAYFAVPMIGAVLHHVNVRLSPEQIAYTMNHAEDKLVMVHEDFLPLVETTQSLLKTVESYVLLAENGPVDTSLPISGEYEQLMGSMHDGYEFPDFDENSIATTFYTTGTTGNPKGVYFSHRQLVLHTLQAVGTLASASGEAVINVDSVYMPLTPMFHVHAWGIPYVATMLGVKQVYPGRYEPQKILELIRANRVTISHCVPTILQMVLAAAKAQGVRFDGWKVCIGGSALTPTLALQAMSEGINIFTGYGMSETCPIMSLSMLNAEILNMEGAEQVRYRTMAGTPAGMVDLRIQASDGQFLPHDGESMGEIVVRAPWLTQGYFKEPEKSEELWLGGWLHTGDIGVISPDGFLEIKDRIKDVIKTGGEWVSSLELETLICESPYIADVAVIGVPDDEWGERPVATVVLATPGTAFSKELIREHLMQHVNSGRINKWWIPEQVDVVDQLPTTSVGKVDKKKIRSMALPA
ncbi:fatty acid--CoA ligase [Motiliproteus coralliicola]|nr:fatty acid--CoA ligase [Motiliproteus coralliicola]